MSAFWTFASSYPSYKKYTSEFIVKKLFENSTDKTLYNDMKKGMHINTCAIRVSIALNEIKEINLKKANIGMSGTSVGLAFYEKLPNNKRGLYEYIIRVTTMLKYLKKICGNPSYSTIKNNKENVQKFNNYINGKRGIVLLKSDGSGGFTGHVDVWTGNSFLGNNYLESGWVIERYFWEESFLFKYMNK